MTRQALWQIIVALGIWIIVIAVSSIIYYSASVNFVYPDEWIRRIIKCNNGQEEGLSTNKMFTNVAFISTGGASSLFGAYFGIMLDSMYLNGTPSNINDTTPLRSLGRLLVSLALVAPLMLPNLLISQSSPMMIVYLFKMSVPFFFAMLALFSVVKLLHVKLRLVNSTKSD